MPSLLTPWKVMLGGGVVAMAGMIVVGELTRIDESPLPVVGGRPMATMVATRGVTYRQFDPRWQWTELARTRLPMGLSGCTVCAVSMALGELGIDIPPDSLNRRLTADEGFTDRGWLIWRSLERVTGDRVSVVIPRAASFEAIDGALEQGLPVVSRVSLRSGVAHWVLIVGKRGRHYLMKDPLGRGDTIETMERYAAGIRAIRILTPRAS